MARYLTGKQVEDNWDDFLNHVKFHIKGERLEKLLAFYDEHANRLATMPASGNTAYHNAIVGGFIDHVNRVYKLSFQVKDLWKGEGATIDFTDEELAMVALNHDLGKFGNEEKEYYLDETEDWKKKKGGVFKHNPELQFMKTSDRSLYLLQKLGVSLTESEWLGISLHDGLYEEAAKSYYVSYNDDYRLRTQLPYVVHQADLAASRIEYDLAHQSNIPVKTKSISSLLK